MVQRIGSLALAATLAAGAAAAQVPQPFPRPTAPPQQPGTPPPQPPAPPVVAAPTEPPVAVVDPDSPTEAELGMPIYPAARYITSYDAGRGQRFYLFGAAASYADLISYYRGLLRERGDEIFDAPPTHTFEVGRFRNDSMAFPPGVTIKDWTWNGSAGYPVPGPDGSVQRYASIVVIVPAPPEPAR